MTEVKSEGSEQLSDDDDSEESESNLLVGELESNVKTSQISLICEYWLRTEKQGKDDKSDDAFIPSDLINVIWMLIYLIQPSIDQFLFLRTLSGAWSTKKNVAVRNVKNLSTYLMKIVKKPVGFNEDEFKVYQMITSKLLSNRECLAFLPQMLCLLEIKSKVYCLFDFCDGGHVSGYLKYRRFKEREAMVIAAEMTLALECLHHRFHTVHRSVNPSSVLINHSGHITLEGFKSSVILSDPSANGLTTVPFSGPIDYLAPEIVDQRAHGFAVDWWALGITVYELVLGLTPFKGDTQSEICQQIKDTMPEVMFTDSIPVSDEFKQLISALLMKDPRMRSVDIRSSEWWLSQSEGLYADSERLWTDLSEMKVKPRFRAEVPPASKYSMFDYSKKWEKEHVFEYNPEIKRVD